MVKKFLFCILLSSGLYAENTLNLIEIMQHLEHSTSLISKGFFHARNSFIQEGMQDLKKSLVELESLDVKAYLPTHKRQLKGIVFDNFSRMDEQLRLMGTYLKKKEMLKAYNAFGQLLNNCFKCHMLIKGQ